MSQLTPLVKMDHILLSDTNISYVAKWRIAMIRMTLCGLLLYQHTAMHLMAKLEMIEEEIFRASSDCKNITRKIVMHHSSGLAKDILFEYVEEP